MNTKSPQPHTAPMYLGIDVAKAELVAAVRCQDRIRHTASYPNTASGIRALLRELSRLAAGRSVVAAMEATGNFGLAAAHALHDAGHAVAVVNPASIKAFMRSTLRRNKTDRADAAAIAEYVERLSPRRWQPRSEARERLRQMVCARDAHVRLLGDVRRRIGSGSCTYVNPIWRRTADLLKRQVGDLDAEIAKHIAACPQLTKEVRLLTTIPGVGPIMAAAMVAYVNCAQFDKARQVCAYIGTCPTRRQSGPSAGSTRLNKQGNPFLRRLVYMGALSAMRHNPHIKASAARWQSPKHKGNGRALTGKQAACAAMNKLVRIMFGVVKNAQPYRPITV